ncbi:uncharacterized protein FA14DRAFT_182924 [Meira miltonrushii]|uniref:Transcription factor domain-containing protein n=1 Tax=Meira miltonrushii TaxID=1280837 RepID=A0A316V1S6_9BASI|nr:uncharacterized protein FA14DRAFT_182924 [Meira miltonrushii]PWN31214.1 hypothetical protein FA14DRAFT_182924 [Meira miltonrushii]
MIVPEYCEMFSGEAKRRLYNSAVRQEFNVSLLETYFGTVHVRCPIFDPSVFLKEFYKQIPDTLNTMLDPVIAVTLACGALFSKHPTFKADRDETSRKKRAATRRQSKIVSTKLAAGRKSHENQGPSLFSPAAISRLPTGRKRSKSRIVDDHLTRAEEALDFTKVHRIAHTTNVIAAFLADGLFPGARRCNANDDPRASGGFADVQRSFWLEVAISHMLELGINRQSSLNELDHLHDSCGKAQLDTVWWFACVSDARQSALCQRNLASTLEMTVFKLRNHL